MSDDNDAEQRRQRLQALRAKREALSGNAPAFKPAAGGPSPRGDASAGALKPGATARKMVAKLVLTTLQAGGAAGGNAIPGKDYTERGVARLLGILRKRAEDPSAPGAELAKRVLTAITQPSADPQGMVAGANIAQLDRLVAFARQGVNGAEGLAAATRGPAAAQQPAGDDIAQMRATIQQLANTVATLTGQLQRINQGQPVAVAEPGSVASPAAIPAAPPEQQGAAKGRRKPNRMSAPATDESDWVDDFIEDR